MAKKNSVSLKDVAAAAGVSTSLVSFVLNGKQQQYRVNKDVAEKVKRIARELNYKPNGLAKSLRHGSSKTIGVIVSDISNQFFADLARYVESATEEKGYMTLFASSDENAEKMAKQVERMLSKEVDGIILVPCEGSEDTIQYLINTNVSFVLMDRYFPELKTSYLCLNNTGAGHDATKALIDAGYKRITFVGYDLNLSHMIGRAAGYREAMADNNLSQFEDIRCVDPKNMKESCATIVREALESGSDALVFATNTIAVNCLYYIKDHGIKVPQQLGLVGFDSDTAFDFFYAPISCIRQPLEVMANKAVEILFDNINSNNAIVQQVETHGQFVSRSSSSPKK